MPENKYEEKKKDEICQSIYDLLEEQRWGAGTEKFVVKIVFRGKLNMLPIEFESKQKRSF